MTSALLSALQRLDAELRRRPPTDKEARQIEYLARLMQRIFARVYRACPEAVGTAEDFGDVR